MSAAHDEGAPTLFTAQRPGTPAAAWTSRLRTASTLTAPQRGDVLVVLAAHPDDETLGAGGLLALAALRGATVRVVVATDGAASHPHSPTHRPDRLAELRRAEVRTALAQLGAGIEPILLGLPDGGLDRRDADLAALLEPHLRDATHVATTWRHDGHPDHEALAVAVERALTDRAGVRLWQFPIWAWHWAAADGDVLPWSRIATLPLPPSTVEAKAAAIAAHVSQHGPLSDRPGDEVILPEYVLEHFRRDTEPFVVVRSSAADGEYFDALYASAEDPWDLAGRFYERRKRAVLLGSLPRERFRRAFEPGCATGELTARLAERCDELLSWDVAAEAVARTRARDLPRVRVRQGSIPLDWPDGAFDLVVLSEIGYYCPDLELTVSRLRRSLTSDGVVVACHWRHPAQDHPQSAEAVHEALGGGLAGFRRLVSHVEDDFLLDVWSADGRSVADAGGLLG